MRIDFVYVELQGNSNKVAVNPEKVESIQHDIGGAVIVLPTGNIYTSWSFDKTVTAFSPMRIA